MHQGFFLSSKKIDLVKDLCPFISSSTNKAYWVGLLESDTAVDVADTGI